jgi:hypothetical protein
MGIKMTARPFIFGLGEEVKDGLSPFKGMVLARTQYATGCNTYGVFDGKLDKEGKPREWRWFDESQLVMVMRRVEGVMLGGPLKGGPCNPSAPSR